LPPILLGAGARTLGRVAARAVTLVAVVALWVVFRADSWPTAFIMLRAMAVPFADADVYAFKDLNLYAVLEASLLALWLLVLFAPSSHELVAAMRRRRDGTRAPPMARWIPAALTGAALYLAIASIAKVQSEFIYFNF
jgi:hypothetical protein